MLTRFAVRRLPLAAVVLAMLATLGTAGCAGQSPQPKLFVHSRHAADIDFDRYRTYAWQPGDDTRTNPVFLDNPDLPGLISAAVDADLTAKGFAKTTAQAAHFLIAMSASIQPVTLISKQRYPEWSHSYNRALLGTDSTATQLNKMAEGTLVLKVIDTDSEGVVWQSQAAGVISRRSDMNKTVGPAVRRMLESFPPRS
jgi:hypothetical protein